MFIRNGFFMATGGYEFTLVLLAASLAVLVEGAGKCSVDKMMSKKAD